MFQYYKLIYISLLLLTSCVKVGEYYVGFNLQPDTSNSEFESGLNVFGLVKCGPDLDTLNYYFEVQKVLDVTSSSVEVEVIDAQIELTRTDKNGTVYTYVPKHNIDGLYFDEEITTTPGDKWDYVCRYDTFQVEASCVVPETPVLLESVRADDGKSLTFTLAVNNTAYLYDVYLVYNDEIYSERSIPQSDQSTTFSIQPEWMEPDQEITVYIFAYDQNLMTYNTTSNTFFKPNAFRPSFSTVDGGYGTFGAVSSFLFLVP